MNYRQELVLTILRDEDDWLSCQQIFGQCKRHPLNEIQDSESLRKTLYNLSVGSSMLIDKKPVDGKNMVYRINQAGLDAISGYSTIDKRKSLKLSVTLVNEKKRIINEITKLINQLAEMRP